MRPAKCLLFAISTIVVALPALGQGYDGQGQPYPQAGGQYPPSTGPGYPALMPQPPGYASLPGQPMSYQQAPLPQAQTTMPAYNAAPQAKGMSVAQWFNLYNQIRHQAQMSPSERQRADSLLSRGMSVLMPGDEKESTKKLLASMVARYQRACQQLKSLPQLNQTANLHHSYYNYFATAGQLFSDYVRVEDNLFATDAATGQPLASSLIQRKQMLEVLEHQCKQLDAATRAQFAVAPYPW